MNTVYREKDVYYCKLDLPIASHISIWMDKQNILVNSLQCSVIHT